MQGNSFSNEEFFFFLTASWTNQYSFLFAYVLVILQSEGAMVGIFFSFTTWELP